MKFVGKWAAAALLAVALGVGMACVVNSPALADGDHVCIDSTYFGVSNQQACGVNETGDNYLRCVRATPVTGTWACFGAYPALIGRDYEYK